MMILRVAPLAILAMACTPQEPGQTSAKADPPETPDPSSTEQCREADGRFRLSCFPEGVVVPHDGEAPSPSGEDAAQPTSDDPGS